MESPSMVGKMNKRYMLSILIWLGVFGVFICTGAKLGLVVSPGIFFIVGMLGISIATLVADAIKGSRGSHEEDAHVKRFQRLASGPGPRVPTVETHTPTRAEEKVTVYPTSSPVTPPTTHTRLPAKTVVTNRQRLHACSERVWPVISVVKGSMSPVRSCCESQNYRQPPCVSSSDSTVCEAVQSVTCHSSYCRYDSWNDQCCVNLRKGALQEIFMDDIERVPKDGQQRDRRRPEGKARAISSGIQAVSVNFGSPGESSRKQRRKDDTNPPTTSDVVAGEFANEASNEVESVVAEMVGFDEKDESSTAENKGDPAKDRTNTKKSCASRFPEPKVSSGSRTGDRDMSACDEKTRVRPLRQQQTLATSATDRQPERRCSSEDSPHRDSKAAERCPPKALKAPYSAQVDCRKNATARSRETMDTMEMSPMVSCWGAHSTRALLPLSRTETTKTTAFTYTPHHIQAIGCEMNRKAHVNAAVSPKKKVAGTLPAFLRCSRTEKAWRQRKN